MMNKAKRTKGAIVINLTLLATLGTFLCLPVLGQTVSNNVLKGSEYKERIADGTDIGAESEEYDEREYNEGLSKLQGEGTKISPFLIRTAEDMIYVYQAFDDSLEGIYYFELKNDIDLSIVNWKEPIGHAQVHPFTGNFIGNNYTINVTIQNLLFKDEIRGT